MFVSDNKIRSIYPYFQEKLENLYSTSEIKHLTNLALEFVLNLSRTDLLLAQDQAVSESELLRFREIVNELQKGKPIQYILGEAEFCGLNIQVNEHVLIPRPETEELVERIRKEVELADNILDVGTGSGCIPLALKSYFPDAKVSGVDVSELALEVARKNSETLGLDVLFLKEDILNPKMEFEQTFDLIVSNPPYVLESDKKEMEQNVLEYEPHLALFVEDSDPLLFYRTILSFSEKNLKNGGRLYFEIHEEYAIQIKQLFLESGFSSAEIHQDFYGKERIVKGIK